MTKADRWTVAVLLIVMLFIGGLLGASFEARRTIIRADEMIAERGEVYAGECFDQRNDLRRVLRETETDLGGCGLRLRWNETSLESTRADLAICQHDLGNIRNIILSCSCSEE